MSKILVIDATGRDSNESKTKTLSNAVFNKLSLRMEDVTYLDLYSIPLPNVNLEILESRKNQKFTGEDSKLAKFYLEQFENADEYIFIFPTWNWSIPAVLKQYVDLIMVSGRSFTYKGMKIVGLLEGKKATIINTTGGPVMPSLLATVFGNQNGVNYMCSILKIMGIKNVRKIVIDGVSYKFKNKEKGLSFDFDKYMVAVEKKCNSL